MYNSLAILKMIFVESSHFNARASSGRGEPIVSIFKNFIFEAVQPSFKHVL
jgi:hypothetical protein